MRLLLEQLATHPGDTWQQRWEAAGLDEHGRPVRDLGGRRVDAGLCVGTGDVTRALASLCALRVIAPSLAALRSNKFLSYEQVFCPAQHDPKLDGFFAAMATVTVSARYKQHALYYVCAALTTQGIGFADLTPEAFLHYAHETRIRGLGRTDNTTYVGHTAWRVLYETGQFLANTPPTLRAATRVPQLRKLRLRRSNYHDDIAAPPRRSRSCSPVVPTWHSATFGTSVGQSAAFRTRAPRTRSRATAPGVRPTRRYDR